MPELARTAPVGLAGTHPTSTLSAPSGVTSIGGANVYAAKLATAMVTYQLLATLAGGMAQRNGCACGESVLLTFSKDHCVTTALATAHKSKLSAESTHWLRSPPTILDF